MVYRVPTERRDQAAGRFESSLSGSTATLFGSLSQQYAGSHGPLERQRAVAVSPTG